MADAQAISPADLLIDEENPRLPEPHVGQRKVLRELAAAQGRKLLALAKDIVEHGLSPAELFIVIPNHDDRNRYIVVEGNRRLVALRALENPESIAGAVDAKVLTDIRQLSKQYQKAPVEYAQCAVVNSTALVFCRFVS